MDCEYCKYFRYFKSFYDEWKGWQYDNECTAPLDDMPRECAIELGYEKEWLEASNEENK